MEGWDSEGQLYTPSLAAAANVALTLAERREEPPRRHLAGCGLAQGRRPVRHQVASVTVATVVPKARWAMKARTWVDRG